MLALVHGIKCQGHPCDKGCTREYRPQCVTLQRTLSNSCVAQNEICRMRSEGYVAKAVNEGPCQCKGSCNREYSPVCTRQAYTNDLRLFSNLCVLDYDICQGNKRKVVPLEECPQ
ncbi:hypothetical protein ACOMHN_005307 [Nucella lapillus]